MTIGVARAARPWMRGFDCLEAVTLAQALAAKRAGFDFAGRYVETLSAGEVQALFTAGLALAPLTEAITGVALTAALGTRVATSRAQDLARLEAPHGVTLWTDHEDAPAGSDSRGYLQARAVATIGSSYQPGLYAGMPQDLTAAELYALSFVRYGRGGGAVPEPRCGFCWYQAPPLDTVGPWGTKIDGSFTMQDFEGRSAVLWWPA